MSFLGFLSIRRGFFLKGCIEDCFFCRFFEKLLRIYRLMILFFTENICLFAGVWKKQIRLLKIKNWGFS